MAKENENQVLREYGNRRKRYKRRRNIIIATLLLLILVGGSIYFAYRYNMSYQKYKVIKSTEIPIENTVGYLSYGSSVIKYGKDGAVAYDKSGKVLWNGSYNMSDPITDSCGQYVVIADRGGTSVHIFSNKGEVGSYSTLHDITMIEVASQGVVAAMMEEGENNYIKLFDLNGAKLGEGKNTVNNAGYPMDFSLSNDGTKLVVIYLSVTKGDLVCNVICTNFSGMGDNDHNQTVGIYAFDKGIVVPKVTFLNNDTFCVYKENGFVLYSMMERPKDIKEISLKGNIKSVLYNKNYAGIVLEAEDGSSRHLMLYDLKGDLALDKTLDFDYKKISMTDEEVIMYNDLSCVILKPSGKVKFKDTFESNIVGFYPINNLDRYYMISETAVSDIQLLD